MQWPSMAAIVTCSSCSHALHRRGPKRWLSRASPNGCLPRLPPSRSFRSKPAEKALADPVSTSPGSPGAAVAVMRGANIEVCKGYGLASIEHGVPITPRTRFRIASVSKQFTVTAALMLAADGKLKLSDPPHKHLKELKPLPVT